MRLLTALCILLFSTSAFGQSATFRDEIRDNVARVGSGSGTTTTATVYPTQGFVAWEDAEDHPFLIIQAALTEQSATPEGFGYFGTECTGVSGGTRDYTAEGVNVQLNRGLCYDMLAEYGQSVVDALGEQGYLSFEVLNNTTFEDSPNTYAMKWFGDEGGGYTEFNHGTYLYARFLHDNTITNDPTYSIKEASRTGTHYTVVVNWTPEFIDYYIDGMMISRVDRAGGPASDMSNFYFAGYDELSWNQPQSWGDDAANGDKRRLRNMFMLRRAQDFPRTDSILIIGDDQTAWACTEQRQLGQGYTFANESVAVPWASITTTSGSTTGTAYGCGYTSSDGYHAYNNSMGDSGIIPSLIRELGQNNRFVSATWNYSKVGLGATDAGSPNAFEIEDIIDYATNAGAVPTVAIINIGTDDIAKGTCTTATVADLNLSLRGVVAKLYDLGTRRIIFWVPPSLGHWAGYDTQNCIDQTALFGSTIAGLGGWAVNQGYGDIVRIADAHTALGGEPIDAGMYVASSFRPTNEGAVALGAVMAEAVVCD